MKKAVFVASAAALAVSSFAAADVDGLVGMSYLTDADGNMVEGFDGAAWAVIDVYVNFGADNTDGFDNADSVLLNIFDSNITRGSGGDFSHSDASGAAGAWSPGLSLDIPGFANSAIDSFVTIGGMPGAVNSTALDPNFGAGSGGSIPALAGWFNQNPPNSQGAVDGDLNTMIGRFVISAADAEAGETLEIGVQIGYNYGAGTGSFFSGADGSFAYVPAPGALALLGLGGLAARRRRG